MSGILPVALHNNSFHFLFSREFRKGNKKIIDWRDFGGTPENNETPKETAIREGWEESSGFLGDENDIKNLIEKKLVCTVKSNKYTVYVVEIPYDTSLPSRFKSHFDKMAAKDPSKLVKDGFYEKDKLLWIKLENIKNHMNKFQPWYKTIVRKLENTFKNFNKN